MNKTLKDYEKEYEEIYGKANESKDETMKHIEERRKKFNELNKKASAVGKSTKEYIEKDIDELQKMFNSVER